MATLGRDADPMTENNIPQDPRPVFDQALDIAGKVIDGVAPDQLEAPTPCAEYDVRLLLGHMVAVLDRVAVVGAGADWSTTPQIIEGVADGDWSDAWAGARAHCDEVWADPAVLGRDLLLPFGVLPGGVALAVYVAEFTIHAWDLARATGQEGAWDDEVSGFALEAMRMGIPAEGRGPEMPFDPVVPTTDADPVVDQLVAWVGRQP